MRQRIRHILDDIIAAPRLPLVYLLPALALCLLLQWQINLFETETYRGLRFSAADLIIPFIGVLIAARLFLKLDKLPQWRIPRFYYALAGLAAIMTYALINGYHTTGNWDRWAFLNKYAGFFVLLAYLGVGGWIGSRPVSEWARAIFPAFMTVWLAITLLSMGILLWYDIQGDHKNIFQHYPLAGLTGNRNAFAFLTLCVIATATAIQMRKATPPPIVFYVLWGIMPLFCTYNASRAGWVIMALLGLTFLLMAPRFFLRHIFKSIIVGTLSCMLLFSAVPSQAFRITKWHSDNVSLLVEQGLQSDKASPEESMRDLAYDGDKIRSKTFSDGFSLWQEHPLTGGGLGAYKDYQTKTRGTFSDVIDCTPLWLLAEMGVVGLAAFAALFSWALWRIFKKIRSKDDPHGAYLGIFLMLVIFAAMSLVHELLYTRFIWFFMGLALALPPEERQEKRKAV